MTQNSEADRGTSGIRLSDKWVGNDDVLAITSTSCGHLKTLEQAYTNLYLPYFSPSAGYDSIDKWLEGLTNPDSSIDYRINIVGKNLRGGGQMEIKGLCVSMYFKDSDTGYLAYIVVDSQFRTEGLGNLLFRHHESSMVAAARENGGSLRGHYLDCQDPMKPTKDGYDPKKRLEKYQAWGGEVVNCGYQLPLVTKPGRMVDDLVLVAFGHPVTGDRPTAAATVDFLRSIYRDNGVVHPERHSVFQMMQNRLLSPQMAAEWRAPRLKIA
jgi:hypothetical protein